MYDEFFNKAVEAEYPGLLDGSRQYDFNDPESVADIERYDEVSSIMDASFNDTERVFISNEVYHFI